MDNQADYSTVGEQGSSSADGMTKEQKTFHRIREGKSKAKMFQMPSNENVVRVLDRMKTSPVHGDIEQQVSPAGRVIIEDIDNVVSAGQKMLTEKNEDEHLQKMTFHAKQAADLTNSEMLSSSSSKDIGAEVRSHLSGTYSSLVRVIKMIVTSTEFRSAIKGLISVLMDVFKYNMGGQMNALSDVNDEWGNVVKGESSGREAAHKTVDIIADSTSQDFSQDLSSSVKPHVSGAMEGDVSKTTAARRTARDVAQMAKERAYRFEVPQEHKEEIMNRLKDALKKFQNRAEYQEALEDLFGSVSNVMKSSRDYSMKRMDTGHQAFKESNADVEWKTALTHAKALLENFFNGNSMDPLITAVKNFYNDIMHDDKIYVWFQAWTKFLQTMLRDSSYLDSDKFRKDAMALSDDTSSWLTENYRGHVEAMYDETKHFIAGAAEDQTNQEFLDSMRILWEDLFVDDHGDITIKTELLDDFVKIIPTLSDRMMYVPLPKFERDSSDFYILAEDAVMKCTGLVPQEIKVGTTCSLDLTTPPRVIGNISLHVSQIQASAQNIHVAFEKKKRFLFFKPKDEGRLDVYITGKGLTLDLEFSPWVQRAADGTMEKGVDLVTCNVDIDKLRFNFHDMQRRHMRYKLFRYFIEKRVKKEISRAVSQSLRDWIEPKTTGGGSENGNGTTVTPPSAPVVNGNGGTTNGDNGGITNGELPTGNGGNGGGNGTTADAVNRWAIGSTDTTTTPLTDPSASTSMGSRFRGMKMFSKNATPSGLKG